MTHLQTLRSVVVPQAFRVVIPPLTNELVLLLKDTALLSILGTTITSKELTKFGKDGAGDFNGTPLVVAGMIYLAITIPLTQLVGVLERRNKASMCPTRPLASRQSSSAGCASHSAPTRFSKASTSPLPRNRSSA